MVGYVFVGTEVHILQIEYLNTSEQTWAAITTLGQ